MTTHIDLPAPVGGAPAEYAEIADTGVDIYGTNASAHTMYIINSPTAPAATDIGHPVSPGSQIFRDPLTTDKLWAKSEVGGRITLG